MSSTASFLVPSDLRHIEKIHKITAVENGYLGELNMAGNVTYIRIAAKIHKLCTVNLISLQVVLV